MRFIFPLFALLLTACNTSIPKPMEAIHFTQMKPFHLSVLTIDVEKPATFGNANVPLHPMEAMQIWVQDRIYARGDRNALRVIVHDASVTESTQKPDPSTGTFVTDKDFTHYEAKLDVELRLYEDRPIAAAVTKARATHTLRVPNNVTLAERRQLQHQMVIDLIQHINAELEKNLHQYFSPYIIYTPY